MKRKFKRKRKIKKKYLLFILLIIIIITFCKYLNIINLFNINDNMITLVLESENKYSESILNKTINSIKTDIFNNPINLLKNGYEYKNEEVINLKYKENDNYKIYIYNTHENETYSSKYIEEYNIDFTVLNASYMLKEKLDNIGINTLVESGGISNYMKEHGYNHGQSYIASRVFLKDVINKYPDMDLYIDLHRDAASHLVSTTTINNKECAKVLFVIGLEYDTYQNNLDLVTYINNLILNKYPTLTRGIMKKEGYGVNGVYNQDLASNVILIEIGGNENNIEEVNNTLDLISEIIGDYINEKEKK